MENLFVKTLCDVMGMESEKNRLSCLTSRGSTSSFIWSILDNDLCKDRMQVEVVGNLWLNDKVRSLNCWKQDERDSDHLPQVVLTYLHSDSHHGEVCESPQSIDSGPD